MSVALRALQRRTLPHLSPRLSLNHRVRYKSNASHAITDYHTLPPHEEWRSIFSPASIGLRDRVSLVNHKTSIEVARSFLSGKSIAAGKHKVVIEAFPGSCVTIAHIVLNSDYVIGPGALSRALLTLPSDIVKKLIILEDSELYLPYLYVSRSYLRR